MKRPIHRIPPRSEGGFSYVLSPTAILVIAAVLMIVLAVFTQSPISGIDSGLKWLGATTFSETFSIAIPPLPHTIFAQNELPPCPQPFLFWNRNELYPVFPVLPMVLNGLTMRFSGQYLWRLWSLLPAIALLALLLHIARKYQFNTFFSAILFLFATPIMVYAVTYWEHSLGTALACGGLWLLLRKQFGWLILGAFLLGLAPWVRIELIGWSALALLIAFKTIPFKQWIAACLTLVIGLALGAQLNHLLTGSWMPLQILTNAETGQTLLSELQAGVFPYRTYFAMFLGAGNVWWTISLSVLIVVGLIGWKKNNFFSISLMFVPIVYLLSRLLEPYPVFMMIRSNGLLFTMPIVLFAPWGWKSLPDSRVWGGAVLGLLLAVLAMGGVLDGIHWSVRFLLPVAFPATLAALFALRERPLPEKYLTAGLIGIVAMTVYGIIWYGNIESRQRLFQDTLRNNSEMLASDVAWVGGDAAPLLRERDIVFLPSNERIGRFLLTLKQNRQDNFQFVRMPSGIPLTEESSGNWNRLVILTGKRFAPTPEKGQYYRIELYRISDDSVALAQLAGELAAKNFSRGDERGVKDAEIALAYNPNDYRPAVELLAYGIETKNRELVLAQLNHFQTYPLPQKYKKLVEDGVKLLNSK